MSGAGNDFSNFLQNQVQHRPHLFYLLNPHFRRQRGPSASHIPVSHTCPHTRSHTPARLHTRTHAHTPTLQWWRCFLGAFSLQPFFKISFNLTVHTLVPTLARMHTPALLHARTVAPSHRRTPLLPCTPTPTRHTLHRPTHRHARTLVCTTRSSHARMSPFPLLLSVYLMLALFRGVVMNLQRRQLFGSALSSSVADLLALLAQSRCGAWDIMS